MRRWLGHICLLACLLLTGTGCNPAMTITVMQHPELSTASFPAADARCRELITKVPQGAYTGWSWRIGIYELNNPDVADEAYYWRCLMERGWQPVLQVIGPTRASEQDFRHALNDCLAGTPLVRLVPARLSGTALLAIVDRMQAHSGIFGDGSSALSCLQQRHWRIVREVGFLVPGRDAVARSVILPPIVEEFAGKFVDTGSTLLRDMGQGIHWRKVRKQQNTTGRSTVAIELIDASCRGSFQDAEQLVASLNQIRADGHDDWRLPMIDEAQSLANYVAWSGLNVLETKPVRILGLVWTGEQGADRTPLAVDLATGAIVPLGSEGMYGALILPVAGRGWHGAGEHAHEE